MRFRHLLVANRGEIAVRIIRGARELGMETVAIYSEPDRAALHVVEADKAVCVGPAPATESYLNVPAVLEAARRSGAEAIHPGYGFLAENPDFAQAVIDAGLIWVGPPPAAMRLLGDKSSARQLAARVGVPTVPGDDSEMHRTDKGAEPADAEKANAALVEKSGAIGYPLLLKAVAGGGGKGMRRVDRVEEMPAAITAARREAFSSFGDSRLLMERFVTPAHHVEFQIFADSHGQVIHLGERECSIQRRHQKIIEETPSPTLDEATRARMAEAAMALVRAAGYRSAGTCEFLLDESGHFYFLEVNARLQVEHPITEMVTGLDLVRMQLVESFGKQIPLGQALVEWRGRSMECRLYAEDPARGFLPSAGPVLLFRRPEGPGVRVDSGIATGWEVGRPLRSDPGQDRRARLLARAGHQPDAARPGRDGPPGSRDEHLLPAGRGGPPGIRRRPHADRLSRPPLQGLAPRSRAARPRGAGHGGHGRARSAGGVAGVVDGAAGGRGRIRRGRRRGGRAELALADDRGVSDGGATALR